MTIPKIDARKFFLHAAATALIAAALFACAARVRSSASDVITVEVGLAVPNRCSGGRAQTCSADDDCPRGEQCLSLVTTDIPAFGRDGGHTVRFDDGVLWIFGDTFTPQGLLSSTAGWGRLSDPQTLSAPTDDAGMPLQFFPFTDSEAAFNDAHARVPECCGDQTGCNNVQPYCNCAPETDCAARIALWPGDGVTQPDGALLFYEKFVIGAAPYDFRRVGVGLAHLAVGGTSAQRLLDENGEPRLLFGAADPGFARGLTVVEDKPRFYLYANVNRQGCAVDVIAARVEVAAIVDHQSYQFWNGSTWTATLDESQPILTQIPGGLGSVMWDEYLGRYLSAWNDLCTGGRTLLVRTAPEPHGPWSRPLSVDLAPVGATHEAYYGLLHPEFGNGRFLLLSYFQPVLDTYGQMRLVRLTLG
jgi:hypothetical protein